MLYELFYFIALPFNLLMSVLDVPFAFMSDIFGGLGHVIVEFLKVVGLMIGLLFYSLIGGSTRGKGYTSYTQRPYKTYMACGEACEDNDPTTPMRERV